VVVFVMNDTVTLLGPNVITLIWFILCFISNVQTFLSYCDLCIFSSFCVNVAEVEVFMLLQGLATLQYHKRVATLPCEM